MSQTSLEFQVSGPNADSIASELAALIQQELGKPPHVRPAAQSVDERATRGGEPSAWIPIVLSLPGAILATVTVAQQLKAAEHAKKFIAWARQRLTAGDDVQVVRDGRFLGRLHEVDEAKIVEFLKHLEHDGASDSDQ